MSFDEELKPVYSSLVSTIRSASQLAAQDISFYKTLDNELSQSASGCSDRLLHLINRTIQTSADSNEDIDDNNDLDELQENWKQIEGVLDGLFEKTDLALDDFRKQHSSNNNKSIEVNAESPNNSDKLKSLENLGENEKVVTHSKDLPKPQERFHRKVDNSLDSPFKPLITSKPHAISSFEESMQIVQGGEDVNMGSLDREDDNVDDNDNDNNNRNDTNSENPNDTEPPHYKQPYKCEIENQNYPALKTSDPVPSIDWDKQEPIYVDTKEKLDKLVKDLKKSKDVAIDLEHHDYRSFHGFVCLMQISNREKDWIIDTLVLRDELEILNTIFANPKIVKVFHGAYMDIIWLQRDFGLYIVSLFDTYCASKALGLKKHSLAYLLETYAQFKSSKEYQRADWRVRPIPKRMLGYARADTHFLLNIYDTLKNNLIAQGKLEAVLTESRTVAKQRYEKPGYVDFKSGWKSILSKYSFTPAQKIVFQDLYDWRDRTARRFDESTRYIMPNHILATLCYTMPDTVTGVLGISNGLTSHIRSGAKEIAKTIESSKQKIENNLGALEEQLIRERENSQNNSIEQDEEVIIEKAEANYTAYEREFQKAVNSHNQYFDEKKMEKAYGLFFNERTFFLAQTIQPAEEGLSDEDVDMDLDPASVSARNELINNKLNLYVPLPPLTAEPFSEMEAAPNSFESIANEQYVPQSVEEDKEVIEISDTPPAPTPSKEREEEDEITLLNNGDSDPKIKKRKSAELDGLDDMDAQMLSSKARRKHKRRKLRLMEKAQIDDMKEVNLNDADEKREEEKQKANVDQPGDDGNISTEVFDYNNASSVLEKQGKDNNKKKNKKEKQKEKAQFDPYVTNDDNPKARKKGRGKKKNSGVKSLSFKQKKS